jgi:succinyl-CoA synthetase beta subunit
LLDEVVHNYPVESILVEELLPIEQEAYASVTFNSAERAPVLVFSSQGGMDIETIASEHPDAVVQYEFDLQAGIQPYEARRVAARAGVPREYLVAVAGGLVNLVDVFVENECQLVEVNPLALCEDGRVVAADAVVKLDEHAENRYPDLHQYAVPGDSWRPPTPLEREIHEADRHIETRPVLRFIELDGEIGNCITGGGGSLMAMDVFRQFGGEPATYMDATPTQNPAKYELATVAALKTGVKGLIFGGNILSLAETDIKARGLVDGLKRAGVDPQEFPVVARLSGPNQERAEEILNELPGIESLGDSVTIEQAIRRVIDRAEDNDEPTQVDIDLVQEVGTEGVQ